MICAHPYPEVNYLQRLPSLIPVLPTAPDDAAHAGVEELVPAREDGVLNACLEP